MSGYESHIINAAVIRNKEYGWGTLPCHQEAPVVEYSCGNDEQPVVVHVIGRCKNEHV